MSAFAILGPACFGGRLLYHGVVPFLLEFLLSIFAVVLCARCGELGTFPAESIMAWLLPCFPPAEVECPGPVLLSVANTLWAKPLLCVFVCRRARAPESTSCLGY